MSLDALARNPVLKHELEVRASRDESYRLFNYAGPGLFVLLLQAPVMFGLMSSVFGWPGAAWTTPLYLVTVWLLILYFSHAAARFCAGSVVVERERGTMDALRLIPLSSRQIFVGKYLSSIAPLLVEAAAALPVLAIYAWYGAASPGTVLLHGAFNFAVVLFFGAWGMFWSLYSRDVLSAVSRAFCTVLAFNFLPVLLAIVSLMSEGGPGLRHADAGNLPDQHGLPSKTCLLASPICLGKVLMYPSRGDVEGLLVMAGVAGLLGLLLYRATLRRLD